MAVLLNWTAHSCSGCETSDGRCGFTDNKFTCFCGDRPHMKACDDGNFVGIPVAYFGLNFFFSFGHYYNKLERTVACTTCLSFKACLRFMSTIF